MGKWSSETIAGHADKLQPLVGYFQSQNNDTLANSYASQRKRKEEVEAELKEVNLQIRAAEMVFAERFAEDDVKTMKFNNGMSLTISVEQGYVFEDKEAFIRFLEDNGWRHELTVPANSLNRLMRDLTEKKLLPPAGSVKLGEPFTKFSCRGLK